MDTPHWEGQASWALAHGFSLLVSCLLNLSMWVVG